MWLSSHWELEWPNFWIGKSLHSPLVQTPAWQGRSDCYWRNEQCHHEQSPHKGIIVALAKSWWRPAAVVYENNTDNSRRLWWLKWLQRAVSLIVLEWPVNRLLQYSGFQPWLYIIGTGELLKIPVSRPHPRPIILEPLGVRSRLR